VEAIEQIPPEKRAYIDESGVKKEYQREYAYAPRGKKVQGAKKAGKGKGMNIIGAKCNGKHLAVRMYEHTTNAAFFESWFSELLKVVPRGCTIILDNARFHRKDALLALIKKTRRKIGLLFLPPYSPDFNPIEKTWANLKKYLRHFSHNFASLHEAITVFFELC
jgi:putative transposase